MQNVMEENINVHKLDSMRKWINDKYDMDIKQNDFNDTKSVCDTMISVIENVFYKDYNVKIYEAIEFIGNLKNFRLDNIDEDKRINYIYLLQILLTCRGYNCGFNGIFDKYTKTALRKFYTDNHIYGIGSYVSGKNNMYIFKNFLNKENISGLWISLLTWSTPCVI